MVLFQHILVFLIARSIFNYSCHLFAASFPSHRANVHAILPFTQLLKTAPPALSSWRCFPRFCCCSWLAPPPPWLSPTMPRGLKWRLRTGLRTPTWRRRCPMRRLERRHSPVPREKTTKVLSALHSAPQRRWVMIVFAYFCFARVFIVIDWRYLWLHFLFSLSIIKFSITMRIIMSNNQSVNINTSSDIT